MKKIDKILIFLKDGEKTKKEIVAEFGNSYFYGADKHIGKVLSRGIKSNKIIRVKRGVYSLPPIQDSKQMELF